MSTRTVMAVIMILSCMGSTAWGEEGQGLSERAVMQAMRPYLQALRDCADRQHVVDRGVSGRMDLTFTIGNRGRITRFGVLSEGHARTFMAGCADGVFRAMKFPVFKGTPVVIPHFPVEIGDAPEKSSMDEEEEEKPPDPKEAPRKIRDKVVRRLNAAAPDIRACLKDHPPEGRKKPKPAVVTVTFSLNPLGRIISTEVVGKEHNADHVAGCVAGVLAFTEFPVQGADTLTFSRVKLPRI